MMSQSHIDKALQSTWNSAAESKVNIFVLISHNKLQLVLIKKEKFLQRT